MTPWRAPDEPGQREWCRRQRGQGLAEYALILALIVVIAIAALVFMGTQISAILSSIATSI